MPEEIKTLIAGVPRETYPGERRVALIPAAVAALKKLKVDVVFQAGAGADAGFPDSEYAVAGATIAPTRESLFESADVILQVRAAGANRSASGADLALMRDGQTLIGLCDPFSDLGVFPELAAKNISCFALELLPRITRAQSMDVLSSQASLAGYKAVVLAAHHLPRMFPMMMTAAGTITAAKVFVIGAGVAGLQSIATARRMGAVVKATDVRSAAKENVLSLGAKFIDMGVEDTAGVGGYARGMDEGFYRQQQAALAPTIAESDVIITTAAVPGKRAPVLISGEAVRLMAPGSLVVDLAAEQGGNCELTKPGETIVEAGVSVIGCVNLPSTVPYHASQMFSRNVTAFLALLVKDGRWEINRDDEIVQGTLVTADRQIVHPKIRESIA